MTDQACPLNEWDGVKGHCETCNGPFPDKRKRRWCSPACSAKAYQNHAWGWARNEARNRARDTTLKFPSWRFICDICGDGTSYGEVDHIVPVRGAYRGAWSCINHQDNLRWLCHDCHKVVTRLQRTTTRTEVAGTRTIACWDDMHSLCFQHLMGESPVYCTCECHPEIREHLGMDTELDKVLIELLKEEVDTRIHHHSCMCECGQEFSQCESV